MEDIKPSFVNPPCGSWSDFKLYPTKKFLYINRDKDRPDIAYYIPEEGKLDNNGTYYVGESKASYKSFKSEKKYNKQIDRINRLITIIDDKIGLELKYKTFIIFKGTEESGRELINEIHDGNRKRVDYIIVIEENNKEEYNIRMIILEV